jgi:hypothetical protein
MEKRPGPPPKPRSQLTQQLVSEECVRQSLKYLLANLKRYTLLIEGTGNELRPQIMLTEEEAWPSLGNAIDTRLLTARHITILATTKDRGTAEIDLTTRYVITWVRSQEISDLVDSFNKRLKSGARRRFIRQYSGNSVYLILASALIIGLGIAFLNGNVALIFWALCIVYLVIDFTIVRLSGPLRIWPQQLKNSKRPRLWQAPRLRISKTSWQLIWTSVFTGIVVLLVERFLIR